MFAAVGILFFEQLDIFLHAQIILCHIICVRDAYIAEVPRFILYLRDILLILGITQDEAVLAAVLGEPLKIARSLIVIVRYSRKIERIAGLMLTVAGLCNSC